MTTPENPDTRYPYPSPKPEVMKLLPLSEPHYYILTILTAGPNHGYILLQMIPELSKDIVKPAVGNFYVALRALQERKLIYLTETDERRKICAITEFGQEVLETEKGRMRFMLRAAQNLKPYEEEPYHRLIAAIRRVPKNSP